jgi:hypothetical protein
MANDFIRCSLRQTMGDLVSMLSHSCLGLVSGCSEARKLFISLKLETRNTACLNDFKQITLQCATVEVRAG